MLKKFFSLKLTQGKIETLSGLSTIKAISVKSSHK